MRHMMSPREMETMMGRPVQHSRAHISPSKAREMMENPPHDQPLSGKQKRLFGGIAHGMKSKKGY